MIVVLSPAKTLDFSTPPTIADCSQPDFLSQSQLLIQHLKKLSPLAISELMGISDPLAVLNAQRYAEWSLPFTAKNAKQAVQAFNGDVYDGLDATTLSSSDLLFAQDHVRILSGLYGLLRPLDLIQAYRLEMGTRLTTERGKDLYAFWGERITAALKAQLKEQGAAALVNLASEEYFKSVHVKTLDVPVIQPVFEDWSASKYKVVSFFAKKARGWMARFAILERVVQPEKLKEFSESGYRFAVDASDDHRWVFRRRLQ